MKTGMKIIRLMVISLLLAALGNCSANMPPSDKDTDIAKYDIRVIPFAGASQDSLPVFIGLNIPYTSLQFVKQGSNYLARYETSFLVQSEDGQQFKRLVWQDSLLVANYSLTVSTKHSVSFGKSVNVPKTNLVVKVELLDLETQHSKIKSETLTILEDKPGIVLFQPVLLVRRPGNWGFGKDLYPLFGGEFSERPDSLQIFITGFINPKNFTITTRIKQDDKTKWSVKIPVTNANRWFNTVQSISADSLSGLRFTIEAELTQGRHVVLKQREVILRKKGISRYVEDIDSALDQMQYILTTKEKSELRGASTRKREKLFNKFWEARDPTPTTTTNELMEEYYRRVNFSNEKFSGFQAGWRSDMGMIYILMGPPDDLERVNMPNNQNNYEVWYYYRINERFVFLDVNGFGEYRLNKPFLGYPSSGW